MPDALRTLIEEELAHGNEIQEVASIFPAPPVGVAVRLAHPVRSRPRASTEAMEFYDRNASSHSGEWHDAQRYFFVLEPPRPPDPEVDMEQVRAHLAASHDSSGGDDNAAPREEARAPLPDAPLPDAPLPDAPLPDAPRSARDDAVHRFAESMRIDYERWKEGIGYDLASIDSASPEERMQIEALLVPRASEGWRDVEALARLGTARAIDALRAALRDGNAEVRAAVLRHAPQLVDDATRTASLVRGLQEATFFAGLSEMLDDAATFHPPAVVDTLFRETLHGPGDKAVHLAALLFHLHDRTPHRFDWEHRPFFLRFNTDDRAARASAFAELCATLGVDPTPYR